MKHIVHIFFLFTISVLNAQVSIGEKFILNDRMIDYYKMSCQSITFSVLEKIEAGKIEAYSDSLFLNKINLDSFLIIKVMDSDLLQLNYFDVEEYEVNRKFVKILLNHMIAEEYKTKKVYCYIRTIDFKNEINKSHFVKLYFETNNSLSFENFKLFAKVILDSISNKTARHILANKQRDSFDYPYFSKPQGYYFEYNKTVRKNCKIEFSKFALYGENGFRLCVSRRFRIKDLKRILNKDEIKFLKFIAYESIFY